MSTSVEGSCAQALLLLSTTENRGDGLRASKNLIEFGSPRPSVGEGLGVKGRAQCWMRLASVQDPSSRAGLRELNQQRGIPLTPSPSLLRWGEGSQF